MPRRTTAQNSTETNPDESHTQSRAPSPGGDEEEVRILECCSQPSDCRVSTR